MFHVSWMLIKDTDTNVRVVYQVKVQGLYLINTRWHTRSWKIMEVVEIQENQIQPVPNRLFLQHELCPLFFAVEPGCSGYMCSPKWQAGPHVGGLGETGKSHHDRFFFCFLMKTPPLSWGIPNDVGSPSRLIEPCSTAIVTGTRCLISWASHSQIDWLLNWVRSRF